MLVLALILGAVGAINMNAVTEYEGLVEQTVELTGELNRNRGDLDAAAAAHMENCAAFLESRNEAMRREFESGAGPEKLAERLHEITLVNDIIDLGNATRIACFKSRDLQEPWRPWTTATSRT